MKLSKSLVAISTALCAAFSVSACVNANDNKVTSNEITKVIYTCKNSKTMEVLFINTAESSYAVITQMNEMIPMEIMKMASGANYQAINKDYTYKLYTKGEYADLVEGNDNPVLSSCKIDN